MSGEIQTGSLELTGDFHFFTYVGEAASKLNGQDRDMPQIEIQVDREKTAQDESLPEGHYHFLVEGIRRGMKAKFLRTLAEVEEANPRFSQMRR